MPFSNAQDFCKYFGLQSVRIIHFRKEIDRMNRMNRIPKEQNDNVLVRALSCKSCSSCPKHLLLLRLAALGAVLLFVLVLGSEPRSFATD
jgi:hypothetical protein